MPWETIYTDWPKVQPQPVGPAVLSCLKRAEDGAVVRRYLGGSPCRLCNKHTGGAEFYLADWIWPEGLRHYLTEHNVHPSREFLAFLSDTTSWHKTEPH